MRKLTDLVLMQMGTSGTSEEPAEIVHCPECAAEGMPSQARNSGRWLAVHFGGCSRETVWGESSAEVSQLWKEQNQ